MSRIFLNRYQAEAGALPPVCVRCGQPARQRLARTIHSEAAKMTVRLPFCDAHAGSLVWHATYFQWGLILYFALSMTVLCMIWKIDPFGFEDYSGWVIPALGLGAVCWLACLLYMRHQALRAAAITPDGIELAGVAEAFVNAVVVMHRLGDAGLDETEAATPFRRAPSVDTGGDQIHDPSSPAGEPYGPGPFGTPRS